LAAAEVLPGPSPSAGSRDGSNRSTTPSQARATWNVVAAGLQGHLCLHRQAAACHGRVPLGQLGHRRTGQAIADRLWQLNSSGITCPGHGFVGIHRDGYGCYGPKQGEPFSAAEQVIPHTFPLCRRVSPRIRHLMIGSLAGLKPPYGLGWQKPMYLVRIRRSTTT
jgi:hypothetical protein